ncbi:unnamed protein product [Leuciscus chuanchicus]
MTQGVDYEDRASLFIHGLMKGNVSLRVKDFRESDLGVYMCQVTSGNKTHQIKVNVAEEENFQLVAPSTAHDPEVSLGSDFIIPCHLSPGISALDMEIRWSKDTASVCLYKDRRLTEGVFFKGRVISKDRSEKITVRVRINPAVQPVSRSPIQDGNAQLLLHKIKWFKETDCVCVYKNRHVTEGRAYKDRVSLITHELERGNVSLHLSDCSVSDVGDYHCQVVSRDRAKEITVGVRMKPEVQPVSQSPTSQDRSIQLMLFEGLAFSSAAVPIPDSNAAGQLTLSGVEWKET